MPSDELSGEVVVWVKALKLWLIVLSQAMKDIYYYCSGCYGMSSNLSFLGRTFPAGGFEGGLENDDDRVEHKELGRGE